MTIGNTAAAAPGTYSIDITGTYNTGSQTNSVQLNVANQPGGVTTLLTPANNAVNVTPTPTFTWSAASQAASYRFDIATDAGFTNIVHSAAGLTGTSYVLPITLNTSVRYYWRVYADNACGTAGPSATWSFTTLAAPGDCSPGATPNIAVTRASRAAPAAGPAQRHGQHLGHVDQPTRTAARSTSTPTTRLRSPTSGWSRRPSPCPTARTRWCSSSGTAEHGDQRQRPPATTAASWRFPPTAARPGRRCPTPTCWSIPTWHHLVPAQQPAGQPAGLVRRPQDYCNTHRQRQRLCRPDGAVPLPPGHRQLGVGTRAGTVDDVVVQSCQAPCAYDVNGSGGVDIVDVQLVAGAFGTNVPAYDFNGNDIVDVFDIQTVAERWQVGC